MSEISQPWSGAWWRLSLLKHEYNLLIRLWPALPAKIWTRLSFWFPLNAPVDSLWISRSIFIFPALSAFPSHPALSLRPLFHNMALCSLNVNHISVSFIRPRARLMFSERCQHHQALLLIHDDFKVARGSGSVFSLSKYTPNRGPDIDWLTYRMPASYSGDFKSIIVQTRKTSCMRTNFVWPECPPKCFNNYRMDGHEELSVEPVDFDNPPTFPLVPP